jgi:CheY-like chemotaxis protein
MCFGFGKEKVMSYAVQVVLEIQNPSSQPSAETGLGILVVEDEPLVREVTAEVLRSAGYVVWKAQDAHDAVEVFEQCHSEVRLMIIDVTLPDLAGPALAAKLSAIEDDVAIVLTSGYPEKMTPERAKLRNCVYLAKPFSADALLRQVRKSLGQLQVAAS